MKRSRYRKSLVLGGAIVVRISPRSPVIQKAFWHHSATSIMALVIAVLLLALLVGFIFVLGTAGYAGA